MIACVCWSVIMRIALCQIPVLCAVVQGQMGGNEV